jgi:hypothetical protein
MAGFRVQKGHIFRHFLSQSLLANYKTQHDNYYIQKIKVINKAGTYSLLNKTYRNSQLSTNKLLVTRISAANNWA